VPGAYSEGEAGGPCSPPQSSIEWIFNEKPALLGLISLPEVFCGPQICQKCVGGRTPLGSVVPQTPYSVGEWEGGHPLPNPQRSRRLWRIDSRASASVPPNVKSWLRLWPVPDDAYHGMRLTLRRGITLHNSARAVSAQTQQRESISWSINSIKNSTPTTHPAGNTKVNTVHRFQIWLCPHHKYLVIFHNGRQAHQQSQDMTLHPTFQRICAVLVSDTRFVLQNRPNKFLSRCKECRRGLAMRILSVRPSVCQSNAWIVTKRKKDLSRFLYHTKYHLASFSEKNGWWGRPLLPEIFG